MNVIKKVEVPLLQFNFFQIYTILKKYNFNYGKRIFLLFTLVLLICPAYVFSENITTELIISTDAITDLTWSRDGNTLLFSAGYLEDGNSFASWKAKIFKYDFKSGKNTNLTKNIEHCRFPDLSSNGKKIVFSSEVNNNYDIWVMNVDGKDIKRLTNSETNEYRPSWSPTGEKIVYEKCTLGSPPNRKNYGENSSLWIMDKSGTNKRQLTGIENNDLYPEWVDENTIVFLSKSSNIQNENGKIKILNFKEKNTRELTKVENIFGYKLVGQNLRYYKKDKKGIKVYQINLESQKKKLLKTKKKLKIKDYNWAKNFKRNKKAYVIQEKGLMKLYVETIK